MTAAPDRDTCARTVDNGPDNVGAEREANFQRPFQRNAEN
jgi:hypothetical protein